MCVVVICVRSGFASLRSEPLAWLTDQKRHRKMKEGGFGIEITCVWVSIRSLHMLPAVNTRSLGGPSRAYIHAHLCSRIHTHLYTCIHAIFYAALLLSMTDSGESRWERKAVEGCSAYDPISINCILTLKLGHFLLR